MFKKYRVNAFCVGKEYFRMLRKMFPDQEEKMKNQAYVNVCEKYPQAERENREVFKELEQKEMQILLEEEKTYRESMKIIRTARTEAEINKGVDDGYKALIMEVIPSDEIQVMLKHSKT